MALVILGYVLVFICSELFVLFDEDNKVIVR